MPHLPRQYSGVHLYIHFRNEVLAPCARLLHEASLIGFPLLVKAVSGGGGKGMKLANSMAEASAEDRGKAKWDPC